MNKVALMYNNLNRKKDVIKVICKDDEKFDLNSMDLYQTARNHTSFLSFPILSKMGVN